MLRRAVTLPPRHLTNPNPLARPSVPDVSMSDRTTAGVPPGVTPFEQVTEVRFADIDGMRHVNNAKYATYTENARTAWLHTKVRPASLDDIGFILARIEIDFLAAATLGDTVTTRMWVPRIGSKSWTFAYEMTKQDGTVVARASTVQVAYDYEREVTVPLSERFLVALKPLSADA